MILVLASLACSLAPLAAAGAATTFSDVPADHVFATDIGWLADEGITKGCNPPSNDHFCPETPVTRGQMAAFLVRALDLENPGTVSFVDDDGSAFEDAIEALGAAGITRGCNPPAIDRFCPETPVTRGQMAAFLVRALGMTSRSGDPFVDDDGSVFEADIERIAAAGITRGCNPPANDRFCPGAPVTRGQMAAFLHRAITTSEPPVVIIPQSRRTVWDPGLPDGIPDDPIAVSVGDFGAAGDGVTDDRAAFTAAIDSLPAAGGVVYIPAATYHIEGTIELGDGVVLRGAGSAQTRLEFDLGGASAPAIQSVTYDRGEWRAINDGLEKGTTVVTIANVAGITAPGYAEIEQQNDPQIMYTDPEWNVDWADGSVGEMVRIVAVSGNRVTLAEPLHHSYRAALIPRLRPLQLVELAGVEHLAIERLDPGDGPTIAFKNSAYVWVSDVVSETTYRAHVDTSSVYRCEIRDSRFLDALDHGGGGHGYGASLGRHTTGCLVENNIFASLRHSMIIQVGAAGNVFGYNFSTYGHDNDGNLLPDIALHGHYPAMNLFEGNIVEEIGFGDYWGPAGPGNTALRNCVTGEGIFVHDSSDTQNLVGNVLLGTPDVINIDSSVTGTLRHGNYEAGEIQRDSDITSHDIPSSLYLDAAPGFFGSSPWPATGPDVSPMCVNPAQQRWTTVP